MSKYKPLYNFLASIPASVKYKTTNFSEIEKILGFKLPNSAYEYRQWWANPSSPDEHPHAQVWLSAGWKVDTVNQSDKWVRFQRL